METEAYSIKEVQSLLIEHNSTLQLTDEQIKFISEIIGADIDFCEHEFETLLDDNQKPLGYNKCIHCEIYG